MRILPKSSRLLATAILFVSANLFLLRTSLAEPTHLGSIVDYVYSGGAFRNGGAGKWVEIDKAGTTRFRFDQVFEHEHEFLLHDASRNVWILVPKVKGFIQYRNGNSGTFNNLYLLREILNQSPAIFKDGAKLDCPKPVYSFKDVPGTFVIQSTVKVTFGSNFTPMILSLVESSGNSNLDRIALETSSKCKLPDFGVIDGDRISTNVTYLFNPMPSSKTSENRKTARLLDPAACNPSAPMNIGADEVRVELNLLVDENGKVVESKVLSSVGPMRIVREVQRAFESCEFLPASQGGKYIPSWTAVNWRGRSSR